MKKLLLWVGVIALVICTLSFFIGTKVSATDSKDKIFLGAEKHEIALNEALQLVANFRKDPQASKSQGASFDRGCFRQNSCAAPAVKK
jgi:hypothetical protein